MDDIIKRILDIDKQARDLSQGSDDIQKKAEEELAEKIAETREDYKKQAEEKILAAE